MICSNCGKECTGLYLSPAGTVPDYDSPRFSHCCNAPVSDCPCDSESPESCQACRDRNTASNASKGLYSKDDIREALNSVGVSGYVRDLIMEKFE